MRAARFFSARRFFPLRPAQRRRPRRPNPTHLSGGVSTLAPPSPTAPNRVFLLPGQAGSGTTTVTYGAASAAGAAPRPPGAAGPGFGPSKENQVKWAERGGLVAEGLRGAAARSASVAGAGMAWRGAKRASNAHTHPTTPFYRTLGSPTNVPAAGTACCWR